MPKFIILVEEVGTLQRTYEVEAESKEGAEDIYYENDELEPTSERFKQHDSNILMIREKFEKE